MDMIKIVLLFLHFNFCKYYSKGKIRRENIKMFNLPENGVGTGDLPIYIIIIRVHLKESPFWETQTFIGATQSMARSVSILTREEVLPK